MVKCGVYKITCLLNDKIYIGSSKNILRRFSQHKNFLKKGGHHNYYLQEDWDKYGEENFKFEILEECKEGERYILEQKYLDLLRPFWYTDIGYNIQEDTQPVYDGIKIYIHEPDKDGIDGRGYIHRGFGHDKMPITDIDLQTKTRQQLKEEYLGWLYTKDLWEFMIMCNPDLSEQ